MKPVVRQPDTSAMVISTQATEVSHGMGRIPNRAAVLHSYLVGRFAHGNYRPDLPLNSLGQCDQDTSGLL